MRTNNNRKSKPGRLELKSGKNPPLSCTWCMTPHNVHNTLYLSGDAQSCQFESDIMKLIQRRADRTTFNRSRGTNFQSHVLEFIIFIRKSQADGKVGGINLFAYMMFSTYENLL